MDKYNAEDMQTISTAKFQLLTASFYPNKDLDKVRNIAKLVDIIKPDILSLVEVGGKESLNNFNKHFLNNEYIVYHHPSNSDRGIDIGYLVSKDLQAEISFQHYNNDFLDNDIKFSRGLLHLSLKINGQRLDYFLCHLKSKLDKEKKDFEGRNQRKLEVSYICNIIESLKDVKSHIVCLGDMNGIIYKDETEFELQQFSKIGLQDVLEHKNIDIDNRTSYIYFDRGQKAFKMQLDYALINELGAQKLLDAKILNFEGKTLTNHPQNLKEKFALPSDHYPLFFTFDI
jgi:exonuclease III